MKNKNIMLGMNLMKIQRRKIIKKLKFYVLKENKD